ncbi:MAG TPA: hypothetical protein EYP19_09805, partial [Desulfobacterales bacterium]|nr:hypothetical protein [Desulfobacterales bacterium]
SLRRGEIDIGLVPSIEYALAGHGAVIPGICIRSAGPVRSVLLLAFKPMEEVQTLALDASSLTSNTLVRILFRELYGYEPVLVEPSRTDKAHPRNADAFTLIGDRAMTIEHHTVPHVYDLGAEWERLTNEPFVYAFWLSRTDKVDTRIISRLQEAKRRGILNLDTISRSESKRLGIPYRACYDYLALDIGYDLGERELSGLRLFYELSARHRLAPAIPDLRFAG